MSEVLRSRASKSIVVAMLRASTGRIHLAVTRTGPQAQNQYASSRVSILRWGMETSFSIFDPAKIDDETPFPGQRHRRTRSTAQNHDPHFRGSGLPWPKTGGLVSGEK